MYSTRKERELARLSATGTTKYPITDKNIYTNANDTRLSESEGTKNTTDGEDKNGK